MAGNKTFTPASIDAHCKGRLYDPRTPGLMIEVMPSGKKLWKYERRVTGDGTKVRLSFGQFPARSMSDARQWADVDYETAEAMLNHLKAGMERIYDGYELETEMAAWFRKWENEIVRIARKAGIADRLEVPKPARSRRTKPHITSRRGKSRPIVRKQVVNVHG